MQRVFKVIDHLTFNGFITLFFNTEFFKFDKIICRYFPALMEDFKNIVWWNVFVYANLYIKRVHCALDRRANLNLRNIIGSTLWPSSSFSLAVNWFGYITQI